MAHFLTRLDGTQIEILDEAGVLNTGGREALMILRKYRACLREGERPDNARAAGRLLARLAIVEPVFFQLERAVHGRSMLEEITPEEEVMRAALAEFEREAGVHLMALYDAAEPNARIYQGLAMGWLHEVSPAA